MYELVGRKHIELIEWLTNTWLPQGPPICFVEGFPGVGKTSVARVLMGKVDIPTVIITAPDTQGDPIDDLFLDLGTKLSEVGYPEVADAVERSESPSVAFTRLLHKPLLLVVEEFQRVMAADSGKPVKSLAAFFDRLANRPQLKGRILVLTNRAVRRERWSEPHVIRTLSTLETDEAVVLLDQLLAEAGREDDISVERRKDVANWLGGNPRAMRVLVATLAYDALDDLIGLGPESWEVRDRKVSSELVYRLEKELLERTLRCSKLII